MLCVGNQKGTIHGGELGVEGRGNGGRQNVCDRVLDELDDGALEENLEGSGKVGPNVAPDLDVDVVTVDIDKDVDRVDSGDNLAIRQSLGGKGETHANVDGIHLDLEMTFSNKDPFVSMECVAIEVG